MQLCRCRLDFSVSFQSCHMKVWQPSMFCFTWWRQVCKCGREGKGEGGRQGVFYLVKAGVCLGREGGREGGRERERGRKGEREGRWRGYMRSPICMNSVICRYIHIHIIILHIPAQPDGCVRFMLSFCKNVWLRNSFQNTDLFPHSLLLPLSVCPNSTFLYPMYIGWSMSYRTFYQ